ncbi:MAG: glycosyltransferase family 2 protein [Desulfobacterales bacterium]|nr:glycosyltransferase family 2 protein [Desulfobacterales bacterium]MBF0396549.1 glycosyltransferase family 2 protein [Desulfobacterales bacterium]
MDISFIIVNWNTKELLLNCIDSIFKTVKGIKFEIWLVDNASQDGSVEAVKTKYNNINIIVNHQNLGFAAANNIAFKQMSGRYALLLNTDTVLTDSAISELYNFMENNEKTGIACGQLLNLDGSKQNSIANFPSLLSLLSNETLLRILMPSKFPSKRKEYMLPIEIDSGIGACLIIRKKALDDIGLFDEQYFFFMEETDLAYRMKKAGWNIYFIPSAKIFHLQGKSAGKGVNSRIMFYNSRYLYFKKWNPDIYWLIYFIIFMRLFVNTALTGIGIIFTLGLNSYLNQKLMVYIKLIFWHFNRK